MIERDEREERNHTHIHGRDRLGSSGNAGLGYTSVNGAQAISASNESEQTREIFGG